MNRLRIRNTVLNTDHIVWLSWSAKGKTLFIQTTDKTFSLEDFSEDDWKELLKAMGLEEDEK